MKLIKPILKTPRKKQMCKAVCVFLCLIFTGNLVTCTASALTENVWEQYEAWPVHNKQLVYSLCNEAGVPELQSYVLAIVWHESRFDDKAVNLNSNGTTDRGLMQINDSCTEYLRGCGLIAEPDELFDVETNIRCGIQLLLYHMESDATESLDDVLRRYQVGEGRYAQGGTSKAFDETKEAQEEYEEKLAAVSVFLLDGLDLRQLSEFQKISDEICDSAYLSNESKWTQDAVDVTTPSMLYSLKLDENIYLHCPSPLYQEQVKNILG